MEVKINVDNQKLKVATNLKTYISGTHEFVKFTFNFMDKIWKDLEIYAQFRQGDQAYEDYLDENYSVYLPSQLVAGECLLTLHGANGEVIAITDSLHLTIKGHMLIMDGATGVNMTLPLYNQLLDKIGVSDLETDAKNHADAINELLGMINDIIEINNTQNNKIETLESQEIYFLKESDLTK